MIAKQHRFHGYRSLGLVYRQGSTVRNRSMAIRYLKNNRRTVYRAAVIVSRKVHRSAVGRNRIRRRLYEVIRTHERKITAPYDIVLTVFSDQLADISAAELTDMTVELLGKANILNAAPRLTPRAIVKAREDTHR